METKVLLVALLSLPVGCVHVFPPPATPGPAEPARSDAPIPPGQGRVYIDVVDGPTNVRAVTPVPVEERVGHLVYEDTVLETEQTCRTPCFLDLALGHHSLVFPMRASLREEVDDVLVSTTPSLYRRALGLRRRAAGAGFALGVLGTAFGGTAVVTGGALLPVGLANDMSGLTLSGAIVLGAGAVLTALGIWALAENPTVEQPGAGAQYTLTP